MGQVARAARSGFHGPQPMGTWLLLLFALSARIAAASMDWMPCDRGSTAFEPNTVTLTPDPPVIGSPATFTITGQTADDVVSGSVEIDVSFAGLQIFSTSEDLCTKTACPVSAGPININIVEMLPPIAPPGDYGLKVVARDDAGVELVCINVDFQLVPPSGAAWSSRKELRVRGGATS